MRPERLHCVQHAGRLTREAMAQSIEWCHMAKSPSRATLAAQQSRLLVHRCVLWSGSFKTVWCRKFCGKHCLELTKLRGVHRCWLTYLAAVYLVDTMSFSYRTENWLTCPGGHARLLLQMTPMPLAASLTRSRLPLNSRSFASVRPRFPLSPLVALMDHSTAPA